MTPITQTIDLLPTAPDPATMTKKQFADAGAVYVLAQKAMVPQLVTWTTQVNIVAGEVNANAAAAAASATSAASSATSASGSATSANTSATSAAASATSASGSATSANTSATNAAASAAAAAASAGSVTPVETQTHAAASKATPVDSDELPIVDSAASNALKKLTWANLKATVKSYFDTIYSTLAGNTFTGAQIYSDQQLSRGMLKDMGNVFLDKGNSGTTTQTLDYTAGSHQRITVTGAHTIATSNWPPSGNLGELLLELVNGAAYTITWPTVNWVKSDGTTTTTFASNGVTLQSSGTDWVMLWSRDGGTTIFGKVMR